MCCRFASCRTRIISVSGRCSKEGVADFNLTQAFTVPELAQRLLPHCTLLMFDMCLAAQFFGSIQGTKEFSNKMLGGYREDFWKLSWEVSINLYKQLALGKAPSVDVATNGDVSLAIETGFALCFF